MHYAKQKTRGRVPAYEYGVRILHTARDRTGLRHRAGDQATRFN